MPRRSVKSRSVKKSTTRRRSVASGKRSARRKKPRGKLDFGIPPEKLAVERDRLEETRHRHGVALRTVPLGGADVVRPGSPGGGPIA